MPTLYNDTGNTLGFLVESISGGRLALPDIQRPFVWSNTKIRDLFDSMYRGYPIGTLMLWETGAAVGIRQISRPAANAIPQRLIVDGQQRLTSLYAVLTGEPVLTKTFDRRRVRIAFRPMDARFEVTDAAIERDAEFVQDITTLWTQGHRNVEREFQRRLLDSRTEPIADEDLDIYAGRIQQVYALRDFRFQIVELSAAANPEQVAEIFVRTNSEGVKLNQSDFILTLMSIHAEEGRKRLEAFSRAAVDPAAASPNPRNPFLDPSPDQLLRVAIAVAFRRARLEYVYSILRGKDLETGDISDDRRTEQFARLDQAQTEVLDLTEWRSFFEAVRTAGFRSKKMITSDNALLFTYAFWLIGRREFSMSAAELRPVIARWFFMAHTTGRYTSSPESQLESDLGRIGSLTVGDSSEFTAELDRIIAANFTKDYWAISLPNRLDTASSRSPALFAYLAALNLLDAEVLFSSQRIKERLDPSGGWPERRHLFTKQHLGTIGITGTRAVSAIANMAYLDWPEGAKVGGQAPASYWPSVATGQPADRLRRQINHHALPIGWEQLDYAEFLDRRRFLIAQVVRDGFRTLWGTTAPSPEASVADLIRQGESQTTEFKSTARWNSHTGQTDPRLEHVVVKAVCGFLNAEGGTLLVGVDDGGVALGLDGDFSTLGRRDADRYELFLRDLLASNLSVSTASTVGIRFDRVEGERVCAIRVSASGRPVFARPPRERGAALTEFWVRTGNSTRQLHGDDMVEYQREHWG